MKYFDINNIITLKLEDGKTNLYVNNKLFRQYRHLLLDIPMDEFDFSRDDISIDMVADMLQWKNDSQKLIKDPINISPEVEFWGHCSNLQAWAENNYDTRLLHHSIAFPLLKKVMEIGDIKARQIFKEELLRRMATGSRDVVVFLIENNYLQYLNKEEIFSNVLTPKESIAVEEIEELTNIEYSLVQDLETDTDDSDYCGFVIDNGKIISICLRWKSQSPFLLPDSIVNLNSLKMLNIDLTYITNEYGEEGVLCPIELPSQITRLISLEELHIESYYLTSIPSSIGSLEKLRMLIIHNGSSNIFLPYTLGNLRNLEKLELISGGLKIPDSIGKLNNLIELNIITSSSIILPDSIGDLISLKSLNISHNVLYLPESITKLGNLRELSIPMSCITSKIKLWLKSINLRHEWSYNGTEYFINPPRTCKYCKDSASCREFSEFRSKDCSIFDHKYVFLE